MPRLQFTPFGKSRHSDIPLSPAWSLLTSIQKAGAPIRHDCGGRMLCGTCRVAIAPEDGEKTTDPEGPDPKRDEGPGLRRGLSAMSERERQRLEALGLALDGSIRLACQLHAARDLEARALVPMEDP